MRTLILTIILFFCFVLIIINVFEIIKIPNFESDTQESNKILNDKELIVFDIGEGELIELKNMFIESEERTFKYVVDGKIKYLTFEIYPRLNEYLKNQSRVWYCDPQCPSEKEIELSFLNEKYQKEQLTNLIKQISNKEINEEEQIKILVSLVQNIPYDFESFEKNISKNRYPYEVLYDNLGVCGEKSRLLALFIKEIGYGVVLFRYESENHMAVGIKCPKEYSYLSTGYCFIETTTPSIITDSYSEYVEVGKLNSSPKIIFVSDGKSFKGVYEQYEDALEFRTIIESSEYNNYLSNEQYDKIINLINKYGLEISSNN